MIAAPPVDAGGVALVGGDNVAPEYLLRLRDVGQVFGAAEKRYHALDGIDLDVPRGEFLCLLGPSGCGKSTLLNIVAGFVPATSGSI
jgi:NitT/TauT family transport system ATP-binding protein